MSNAILIKWMDDGKHNKCDLVERKFILEDGELSVGQQVRAQFTKKNSRAKIWGAVVVQRSAHKKKREADFEDFRKTT